MNVVIDDVIERPQTLKSGDIVVFDDGDMLLMVDANNMSDVMLVAVSLVGESTSLTPVREEKTAAQWFKFWDERFGPYTVYPASQYELVLRKRRS